MIIKQQSLADDFLFRIYYYIKEKEITRIEQQQHHTHIYTGERNRDKVSQAPTRIK
jgi:hypothetical protein